MPREDTQFTSTNQPSPEKKSRKGCPSLKTVIREIWGKIEKGEEVPRVYRTVYAMMNKAENGDVAAFKAIADRLEGAPKQEIDQVIESHKVEIVRADKPKDQKEVEKEVE